MGVLFPPDIIPLAFAPNHQMRPEHFGLFGWVAQSLFRHPSRHPRSMLTVHPTSDGSARLSARLQWSRFPHRIASPSSAPTSPYHHRNSPAITLSTSPPLPPLPNLVSPFAAREERERELARAREESTRRRRRKGRGGEAPWGRTRRTRRCSGRGWAPRPAPRAPPTPPKTAWSVPFLRPHLTSPPSLADLWSRLLPPPLDFPKAPPYLYIDRSFPIEICD